MAPALGPTRREALANPPVKPMAAPSHLRLALEGPPAPHDRLAPGEQRLQGERRLSSRELAALFPKPRARFLPWDCGQLVRVRPAHGAGLPAGDGLCPVAPCSRAPQGLG